MKKIFYNLEQLDEIVQLLHSLLGSCSILAIKGPLGAGKTTLIKALLASFGINGTVTSPTFTYVSCYSTSGGKKIYHFDLYRLKTPEEFIDLGFDEYLHDPGAISLIEWPEVIAPLLKHGVCFLSVDYDNDRRSIVIEKR